MSKPKPANFGPATPAMNDPTLPLPSLSPVSGKTVAAKFDGGLLSSNGGVLLLREIEQRLRVAERLANQLRLFLHAGAYWIMWGLRMAAPKRSAWRVAQFDTLRLRLVKIAARVVEMKTTIKVHLSSACPDQQILRVALSRMPRFAT